MLPHKQDFINYLLSNNYSEKTLFNYNRDLSAFESYLDLNQISFSSITRQTVDNFKSVLRTPEHHKLFTSKANEVNRSEMPQDESKIKSRVKRRLLTTNSVAGLASKSVNRMLSSLRKYLRYLIINDFECPLAPDRIEFVKREKKQIELANYDDLVRLIESPDIFEKKEINKARNRAFLELLFSTGMRISEACNLNLEQLGHYDVATKSFIINEKAFITGKGRKQRYVYLTPRCQHFLVRYINLRDDNYPALFIPTKGSRLNSDDKNTIRVSNNYFQMKIVKYRKLLGINIKTSAHSLRHGFATYMAEKGANVVALQTMLGHESLETTTKYLHTPEKLAEDTHRDYHPLNNWDV